MLAQIRQQIHEAKSNGQDTSYLEQLLEQALDNFSVAEFDNKATDNTTDEELAYL